MIGSQYINLESVDSTNNYLKQLLVGQKPNDGSVVITQEQTCGRGQIGNRWESEKGKNIILSFIIYPLFLKIENQFIISKVVSLGIFDFLKTFIEDVKIKWPNDIYVGDKKIAGVLIENSIIGKKIASSVVGIGININQQKFSEKVPNPTSLFLETKTEYDIEKLTHSLIEHINKWYKELKLDQMDKIDIDYLSELYQYQQLHQYKAKDEVFKAKIVDIDHFGRLCLVNEKKELLQFAFKEVEFL